jgi:hypothetical protein
MLDFCQNYFHNIIILFVVNNMSKFLYLAWQGDSLFGLLKKILPDKLKFYFLFCRASGSEYIIPYQKFLKSLNYSVCTGMRINFQCESEDVNERSTLFHSSKF